MQVRMEGKNCIVTGANSGLGYATAEGLASRGATVYMVCRSKERGEAALSKIQSSTSNPNIHLEVCDLSSISEVKLFASKFSSKDKPLHVLVNNAGILVNTRETTPEGLELSFAVNVAATYTMTELMMPLLEKAAPDARVITVSSGGMYTSPLTKDLQFSESKFDGALQYARNKRVQVALTEKWAEAHGDKVGLKHLVLPKACPVSPRGCQESLGQVRKEETQSFGWLCSQKRSWSPVRSILTVQKHGNICRLLGLPARTLPSTRLLTASDHCATCLHELLRILLVN